MAWACLQVACTRVIRRGRMPPWMRVQGFVRAHARISSGSGVVRDPASRGRPAAGQHRRVANRWRGLVAVAAVERFSQGPPTPSLSETRRARGWQAIARTESPTTLPRAPILFPPHDPMTSLHKAADAKDKRLVHSCMAWVRGTPTILLDLANELGGPAVALVALRPSGSPIPTGVGAGSGTTPAATGMAKGCRPRRNGSAAQRLLVLPRSPIPLEATVVLGFSQGAAMALDVASPARWRPESPAALSQPRRPTSTAGPGVTAPMAEQDPWVPGGSE